MKEKIAVLLASYNGEKYIRTQIDSILNQELDSDLLLVVRDDGSSDGTVAILKEEYGRDNVVLLSGNNIGSVASFFELLKYAHNNLKDYQYFALADQDDRWDLDKLQVGINSIRNQGKSQPYLYACSSRLVDDTLNPINQPKPKRKKIDFYNSIIQNFLPGHTYVMNRELLELVFDADPSRIYVHDAYILNVAVLSNGLIFDDTPHADYRQHQGNQLGATNKYLSWITARWKRLKHGDGKKYTTQIEYICEKFNHLMNNEQKKELELFFDSRNSFIKRLRYIRNTKLYRQKQSENLAFKLLYLSGGYNIRKVMS